MIDLKKAKEEFLRYTDTFDKTEPHISNKQNHCLRVMNHSKNIASALNMSEDEINLAELIGLLHDIAKFEQFKQYHTFNDAKSFDHADMALKFLQDNSYIRQFIEDDSYDSIIFKAIKNHNKFKIEEGLDEKHLTYAKIIRDADKIDIFHEIDIFFYDTQEKIDLVSNSSLCDEYYKSFMNRTQVLKKKDELPFERLVSTLSFIFDLNFDVSLDIIRENNYCEKTLSRINFENQENQDKFNNIKSLFYKYINKEF